MAKPKTEESTVLTDILTEIQAMNSSLDRIHEALLATRTVEVAESVTGAGKLTEGERRSIAAEAQVEAKEAAAEAHEENTMPKFVKEYLAANPKATSADLVRDLKISANKANLWVPSLQEKAKAKKPVADGKIAVEVLRAKISEFAEVFGMNEALAVNEQFGGSRKVSGIPENVYEKVFNEMSRRLAEKAPAAEPEEKDEPEITVTKEDIQKVGGAFVKQYGDPAFRELLAKFVEKGKDPKISNVLPAKYAALHEALSNA